MTIEFKRARKAGQGALKRQLDVNKRARQLPSRTDAGAQTRGEVPQSGLFGAQMTSRMVGIRQPASQGDELRTLHANLHLH